MPISVSDASTADNLDLIEDNCTRKTGFGEKFLIFFSAFKMADFGVI